jgi:hypothetical protein
MIGLEHDLAPPGEQGFGKFSWQIAEHRARQSE